MKRKEFEKVLEQRLANITATLLIKGREYSRNDNALHNFEIGARVMNVTRERVLWGFALKHYISIMDILDDLDNSIVPTEAAVDEKFGDLINYLILCEASLKNKINGETL